MADIPKLFFGEGGTPSDWASHAVLQPDAIYVSRAGQTRGDQGQPHHVSTSNGQKCSPNLGITSRALANKARHTGMRLNVIGI